MSKTTILLEGERIHIITPYELKDAVKRIPQARWDKTARVWWVPATPNHLVAINETIGDYPINWDASLQPLIDMAWAIEEAQKLKTADELPDHLSANPSWIHQKQGYEFLNALGYGGLFADMGCGKTKVMVDLVNNNDWKWTMVICPAKVVTTWPKEFRKHGHKPATVVPLIGTIKERVATIDSFLMAESKDEPIEFPLIFVTNYEALAYDPMRDAITRMSPDCVVLDEAQRIKKPGGKMSLFLAHLGDTVPHRFALTGTPMHHCPLDAYAVYRFLDKAIFGTRYADYKLRYAVEDKWGGVQAYINEEDLSERMYRVAFRVTKDILDLPEELEIERTFALTPETWKRYNEMEEHYLTQVAEGMVVAKNVLARMLRLHQFTSGVAVLDDGQHTIIETGKRDLLKEVLEELPTTDSGGKEPVVVSCRFHEDLDAVRTVSSALGLRFGEVSGRRNDLSPDGTYPDNVDVLAVQEQAGGVGIDLSRSHYLIFYSFGPSVGNHNQMKSREHRPGQTDPVRYIYLLAEGTIDQALLDGIRNGQDTNEFIVDRLRTQREERE